MNIKNRNSFKNVKVFNLIKINENIDKNTEYI